MHPYARPTRIRTVVSTLLAVYSVARVAVLFLEAYSIVRTQRAEDLELMELCQRGDARGSAKMREACLRARADLASPVVFKAIVTAVSAAFRDFAESVGSPLKLACVLLFIVSSLVPVLPWARMLAAHRIEQEDRPAVNFISYTPPRHAIDQQEGRWRRGVGKVLARLKARPPIQELDEELEVGDEWQRASPWMHLGWEGTDHQKNE